MEGEQQTESNKVVISDILKHVGEYGRFQRILNIMVFVIHIPISMQMFLMIFSVLPAEWRCKENDDVCVYNGTLKGEDDRRCELPRESWEYITPKDFSIATQFDIHCETKWLLVLVVSIFFIGWGIGAIIIGSIADNFGRKILILPSFLIIMVLGFTAPFLPNIYVIIASRFVVGFFIQGTTVQGLIIISEVVGKDKRPFATIIIFAACSVAWCLLSLQAYFIQNWKILSLVCTLPYLSIVPFLMFIPESIEWLKTHGKNAELSKLLHKMAKWNGNKMPDNLEIVGDESSDHVVTVSKPTDLFRTRSESVRTLSIGYIWMATVASYNGMYMAANQLGGSFYRDFALLCLVDLPGIPLSTYICKRYGRRMCVLSSLLIGAIICITTGIIPMENDLKMYRTVLGIIGNMFLSLAYSGLYIWTVEIFPTRIRSTGVGFVMVCARLATTAVPWVVEGLKVYGYWCSFVAIGVPSLIGFFVGFLLPETKGN